MKSWSSSRNYLALIRQDVDALKHESSLQHPTSVDNREEDETTDKSVQPSGQPVVNNNGGLAAQDTTVLNQGSSWADEMDVRDPLLDDNLPAKETVPIKVVPVTDLPERSVYSQDDRNR